MDPAAAITILAIVLIVLALVNYLVSVILELRKITAGLDTVIGSVGEILQKTEPVNPVVDAINADLAAGTELLEGLLVKKAGADDAAGSLYSNPAYPKPGMDSRPRSPTIGTDAPEVFGRPADGDPRPTDEDSAA